MFQKNLHRFMGYIIILIIIFISKLKVGKVLNSCQKIIPPKIENCADSLQKTMNKRRKFSLFHSPRLKQLIGWSVILLKEKSMTSSSSSCFFSNSKICSHSISPSFSTFLFLLIFTTNFSFLWLDFLSYSFYLILSLYLPLSLTYRIVKILKSLCSSALSPSSFININQWLVEILVINEVGADGAVTLVEQ